MHKKRRPTSSVKTHRLKIEGGSHVERASAKIATSPQELLSRKYYYPAIREEQKHQAYLIGRFVAGSHSRDQLQLAQLMCLYYDREYLDKNYDKPQIALRWAIVDSLQSNAKLSPKPYVLCSAQTLMSQSLHQKRQLLTLSSCKKDDLKSTSAPSRKQIKNILGQDFSSEINMDESQQINKLSKCLKKVLKMHNPAKGYRQFVSEMERKGEGREKEQGRVNMILNLENDFSSIHQEEEESKEGIYGLSQLKRKSDKNGSKVDDKPKEKTSIRLQHFNFVKKNANFDRSVNSTSKNAGKSVSVKKQKQGTVTPDNHQVKSKSKSMRKKVVRVGEKKSKLTDTQKLYYDEVGEKVEDKNLKSSIKQGIKKCEPYGQGRLVKKR